MLNIAGIVQNSLSNGPNMRYVLFLQGCNHKCDGCHNAHTWSTDNNRIMTSDEIFDDIVDQTPLIKGVTISGGEPMLQAKALVPLLKRLKKETNLDTLIYSGFTFEQIKKNRDMFEVITLIDMLVDGKFEKNNTKNKHKYAGSSNQRFFDFRDFH